MDDANIFVAGLFTRGDRHREDFYILSLSPNFIENTASEATAWPFVGAGLLPLHHELVKEKKEKEVLSTNHFNFLQLCTIRNITSNNIIKKLFDALSILSFSSLIKS